MVTTFNTQTSIASASFGFEENGTRKDEHLHLNYFGIVYVFSER